MPNRITGMYSGLDTESLIRDLVKAKSSKVEKLKKEKTRAEWKQDAWSGLNKKLKNLFSSLGTMRYRSEYAIKKTTTSNPNAVNVITGAGAMNSVQSLSIKKLASTGYLTGSKISSTTNDNLTGDSKLSEVKNFTGSGSIDVTVDGKTTTIEVTADTTINNLVSKLNEAGVNANFDEKNQRLFIGAKNSGKAGDFIITANNDGGSSALSALGINAAPSESEKAVYKELASYSALLKKDSAGNFNAEATITAIQDDVTSGAYTRLMASAKADYSSRVSQAEGLTKEIEDLTAQLDNEILTDEDKAKVRESIAAKEADLEAVTKGATLDEMKANLENGQYDVASMTKAVTELKGKIDMAVQMSTTAASNTEDGPVRLTGSDAEIELNGAKFTSSSNNVEVNGLTFTCLAVADDITVTTNEDTDGIYDKVKNFLKEYNEIINEMDKLFNTKTKKGYDVLTDDEKDAMTDKEIEKWEEKVKESLLRNDDNLSSVFNGIKEVMSAGIEIGGQTYYLSNFGISTASYFEAGEFEKNAYHIDGDKDDALSGGNDDVLKTMIANDSETVINFFAELSNNLYKRMDELSATSDYSSFGSFYDDKKYKTDMSDIEKKIAEAEEKLAAYEDKWYSKFSAMETALSKMDSSNQYLSNLFK